MVVACDWSVRYCRLGCLGGRFALSLFRGMASGSDFVYSTQLRSYTELGGVALYIFQVINASSM